MATLEASSTKKLTLKQARAKLVQLRLLDQLQLYDLSSRPWRSCLICGWPTKCRWACEAPSPSMRDCWNGSANSQLRVKAPDGAPVLVVEDVEKL